MATAKLRIFVSLGTEVQIKAANWDTAEINTNGDLVVKLGSEIVCQYARGAYSGFAKFDAVV